MTIHQQSLDYTIDQLFSELGGAAGLVMGTSLVTIVRRIDNLLTLFVSWIKKELDVSVIKTWPKNSLSVDNSSKKAKN